MNGWLLGLAYLTAVNPLRTRLGLPEGEAQRVDPVVAGLGALLAWGVVAVIAWISGPVLEVLEITPETFRIAAGLVVLVAGVGELLRPRPGLEPVLAGWRAAVWPVAFPRLLSPEVAALALTTGSAEGVVPTVIAAGVALGAVAALAPLERADVSDRVLEWTGRVVAVLLVAVGVFLMIDGIRDV